MVLFVSVLINSLALKKKSHKLNSLNNYGFTKAHQILRKSWQLDRYKLGLDFAKGWKHSVSWKDSHILPSLSAVEQYLKWDHPTHPEMGYSYREVAKIMQLSCFLKQSIVVKIWTLPKKKKKPKQGFSYFSSTLHQASRLIIYYF